MSPETALGTPVRQPPPGPITYDEFLEWADDETHAEWVDGQVILLDVTVKERHAAIREFLAMLISIVARLGRPGQVYGEPFQLWLPEQRRGRSPDIFFVYEENRRHSRDLYQEGYADLVVEVISPSSEHRDRVQKLNEYQAAGVPEYWIVDHEAPRVEFRVLGPDGRYRVAFTGSAGEYQSAALPRLRLKAEWLWQERPGSDLDEVLRTLGVR